MPLPLQPRAWLMRMRSQGFERQRGVRRQP